MSDTIESTTSETPAPSDTPVTEPVTDTPPTDSPDTPEVKEGKSEELAPEVLRKKLTDANAEAASYRTKLREAEAKLSAAKTPEEFDAAVTDLKTVNATLERKLLVTSVAAEFSLPPELAEALKGDDLEALKKHAKTLSKFVTSQDPESLGGGLTPGDDGAFDPVAEARKARARRY